MECVDHLNNITSNVSSYYLLGLIHPLNDSLLSPFVWEDKSSVWYYICLIYSGLFSYIYFMFGLFSFHLVFKKDSARLKTKTFLAIYICLAILGFSQALQIALDPYGVIGWIYQSFPQWIIISRSLAVLGFPSLTASYTLVFLTLCKSTELKTTKLWHRDWRIVSSIVLAHYLIVIIVEIIANTVNFAALIVIFVCGAAFSTWGVVICVLYIIAGCRLQHKLKKQCQVSGRHSNSVSAQTSKEWRKRKQSTQASLHDETYARNYDKISKTIRKIIIITYFTAVLGILYAIVSKVSLFIASWLAFYNCFGLYDGKGDPNVWLGLQISIKVIELPLAIIMLYSVTDFGTYIKTFAALCSCKCNKLKDNNNNNPPTPPSSSGPHDRSHSSLSVTTTTTTSSPIPPPHVIIDSNDDNINTSVV